MVRAVLFDLYDTLVGIPEGAYLATKQAMADVAGVEAAGLLATWRESRSLSSRGEMTDTAARVVWCLSRMGATVSDAVLAQMVDLEHDLQWRQVGLLEGARACLEGVRALGLSTGLVSNGPPAIGKVPKLLAIGDLFDTMVFSYEVGHIKPEPEIYLQACARLGVQPRDCVYIGDGNDRELDGASALGMYPVLVRLVRNRAALTVDSADSRQVVTSLDDIPALLTSLQRQ